MPAKQHYEKAATFHAQAIAIAEKGDQMTAEDRTQVEKLLDQVDVALADAKAAERLESAAQVIAQPSNQKNFFGSSSTEDREPADPESKAYRAAMRSYLAKGRAKLTDAELKTLAVGEGPAGGYLQRETYVEELLTVQREGSRIRQIANVLPPVPTGSVIAPTEADTMSDAEWTSELKTANADDVKPFGERTLTPHALAKRILVSNAFLRSPGFDAESWIRTRIAEKHNKAEAAAFINGDGVRKPLGMLNTAGLVAITTAVANTVGGDDLINWVYSLGSGYAQNAVILCNRSFIRKVRLLKDANDQYLWNPGLTAGSPSTILDVPYVEEAEFPTGLSAADAFETGKQVAIIGDFRRYFWIVDSLMMEIVRLGELYAEANKTGYIGRKETDAQIVLPDAFRTLKIKSPPGTWAGCTSPRSPGSPAVRSESIAGG